IRHLEDQRAQFTSISVAAITALITGGALVVTGKAGPERFAVLAVLFACIAVIGLVGLMVLAKTYERIDYLFELMNETAVRLDAVIPLGLVAWFVEHEQKHRQRYRLLSRVRYASAWSWVFALMVCLGVLGIAASLAALGGWLAPFTA